MIMKLYFEPAAFYNDDMESSLPDDKDVLIDYFCQEFNPYYKQLSHRVDTAFKERSRSLVKKVVWTNDMKNYSDIHAECNRLNDYYGLLLVAAKRRHGIWLNNFINK
tara:strand:+ start:1016 stop:1336 length:321 start_codon:yes stop_codon:yes gene_type:complete